MRFTVSGFLCALVIVASATEIASAEDPFKALALIKPARVQAAPAFTVSMPTGAPLKLADYKGNIVLINFWATWCPPCRAEMPAMERLYRRFKERGFTIVAISIDAEGGPIVTPFLKKHELTFPVGLDPEMAVAELYRVQGIPRSFLIDRKGNLVGQAIGPREWDSEEAHALIRRLLKRG
ncbi:MAG: TlpA family protein disulfide reductase [Candidatus Methylomirabilia bacterium]